MFTIITSRVSTRTVGKFLERVIEESCLSKVKSQAEIAYNNASYSGFIAIYLHTGKKLRFSYCRGN